MKFLKKDMAEGNAVAKIMDKIALSHPEVSFRFIRDGKEVLRTPGDNKLRSAIYAVFGKEFANELMPVQYEHGGIKIYGTINEIAEIINITNADSLVIACKVSDEWRTVLKKLLAPTGVKVTEFVLEEVEFV
jgi:DNA mismatch repair ATPase MutL